jgi:predicted DNA-binding transcriptional regulator AlpA
MPNKRKKKAKAELKMQRAERKPRPLLADVFYRWAEGPFYFGYQKSQLAEKIKSGEIPPPVKLSPTGRASGWFGRTIIEHQKKIEAQVAAA